MVQHAEFDVMFTISDEGTLQCDHAKLDKFTAQSVADTSAGDRPEEGLEAMKKLEQVSA